MVVYKKAYRMVVGLHGVLAKLPPYEQFGGIADQMRRASRSVCANLMEGLGKDATEKEESRFLRIAMGSCEEMQFWIGLGVDVGYFDGDKGDVWSGEYVEISKMIYALLKRRGKVWRGQKEGEALGA